MSKTAPSLLPGRQSLAGGVLGLLAWLVLLLAPVAAQAMTRIDPGVPGAALCSAKQAGEQGGETALAPHCPLCTLAQQVVDLPPVAAGGAMPMPATSTVRLVEVSATPPARAPPRANPPRAPPLS